MFSRIMRSIAGFGRYLKEILLGTNNPVWLTLVIVAVTVYLAPNINQAFEREKIRSQYIVSNLNTLTDEFLAFSQNVSQINKALSSDDTIGEEEWAEVQS